MRKLRVLIFIVFGLILNLESFAQTFEIKTGVNLSTISSTNEEGFFGNNFIIEPRILIGVTTELPLTQQFSFETGLLFSSKGYRIVEDNFVYPDSEPLHLYKKVVLNYIDIPLSIRHSTKLLQIPVYIKTGPYFGIAINGKTTTDEFLSELFEGYGRHHPNHEIGPGGYWKRVDYGLQAGAGIAISKIVFGLNYAFGLADISQNSINKSKNRVIGLTLGYKFK